MSEPIQRIVIAGSGAVAWTAAAGLRRALYKRDPEITVVPAGSDDSAVGGWTLPSQRGMHGLLGINEAHFVQQTGATFRLGSEFIAWQGSGSRFLHAHGDVGTEFGGIPFHQYLQSEAIAGRAANPEEWSLAGLAVRLGRFARPMGKDLAASFNYGYHVDAAALATYLRTHAAKLGVCESAAPWAETQLDEHGQIRALKLADGSLIDADLYIDCSGPAACLASRVAPEREDWSHWLPVDRLLAGFGREQPDAPAVTRITAHETGWRWQAPLAGRSLAGLAYGSRWLDDEVALKLLEDLVPGLAAEPRLLRIAAGRRERFWVGNCLALGQSAVELEPLTGASLHFAQLGLATLVELFPRRRDSRIESAEYNSVMRQHADALRDFTLAHYRAGRGRGGEFWQAARVAAPPPRLAHKLDLWAANGRVVLLDHESFEETDWAWLLLGSGSIPATVELQARTLLAKVSPRDLEALRTHLQQLASSMPPHGEFVRRMAASVPR